VAQLRDHGFSLPVELREFNAKIEIHYTIPTIPVVAKLPTVSVDIPVRISAPDLQVIDPEANFVFAQRII
jgi:hypothetical protein